MPTKKKRVGFIPRSDVLDLINKLSFESNLSNSKIINILIEEALQKRGMFNIQTGKIYFDKNQYRENNKKKLKMANFKNEFTYDFKNNFINDDNLNIKEGEEEFLDKEIYSKFIMFLQFQERIKKDIC